MSGIQENQMLEDAQVEFFNRKIIVSNKSIPYRNFLPLNTTVTGLVDVDCSSN